MAENEYPTLQGEAQSWANLICKVAAYNGPTIDLKDLASLDWDSTVETGEQRRNDGSIKAFTRGRETPSLKAGFYADGLLKFYEMLIDVALALGGDYVDNGEARVSMVKFDLFVQHTPVGATDIRQVDFLGVRFTKDSGAYKEGVDADQNETEFKLVRIVRTVNGKRGRML